MNILRNVINELQRPEHVATVQRWFGVIPVVKGTLLQNGHVQTGDNVVNGDISPHANGKNGYVKGKNGYAKHENVPNGHIVQNGVGKHGVSKPDDIATKLTQNGSVIKRRDNAVSRLSTSEISTSELSPATVKDVDGENTIVNTIKNVLTYGKIPKLSEDVDVTYIVTYKPLHYLFMMASLLGNEPFYLTFYPLFGWNADFYVTRVTAMLWCVVMYLGQATKDYLCWPRPTFPPVVNLETQYLLEYGMPSTHAMAGTAMPFTLLYFLSQRYDISTTLLVVSAFVWCGLVCVSRLYLGVHTVGDITIGILYSTVIMLLLLPHLNSFDLFIQTHPAAPVILLIPAVLLATKLYPKGSKSAKADAANIVAIVYGMTVGAWLNYNLGVITMGGPDHPGHELYPVLHPTWTWAGLSLLRLVVGTLAVAITKATLKAILIPLVSVLLGVSRKIHNETVYAVYRFITYTVLGVIISHNIPRLFGLLNIDRAGFYVEGS